MNAQTLPFHQRCDCLRAGKSPAHWRRDLSRKTTPFNLIRRTCDWIQSLPTGAVKLQQEPLMGSCLAELTRNDSHETSQGVYRSRPHPARSRLPSSTRSEAAASTARPTPKRAVDSACPPSKSPSRQPSTSNLAMERELCAAEVPLKLERKASPDLLCQWAKESVPTRIYREPLAEPSIKPSESKPSPCPPLDRSPTKPPKAETFPSFEQPTNAPLPNDRSFYQPPRSSRVLPLPSCPDATHHRRWLAQLAHNTDRRLRRESAAIPGRSTTVPVGQVSQDMQPRSSVSTAQETTLQPLATLPIIPPVQTGDRSFTEHPLTEQWSLPIAGETAPVDLLVSLAQSTTMTRRANITQDRVSTAPATAAYGNYSQSLNQSLPSPRETQRDRPLPARSQQTHSSDIERNWTGKGTQARSPNQPILSASTLPATSANEPTATMPRSTESDHPSLPLSSLTKSAASTPPIAPPAVTPALPALTAPQAGDLPNPSVASALTQHQAQQEAIAPADLGLLADQIKRILNEEARRHGINL